MKENVVRSLFIVMFATMVTTTFSQFKNIKIADVKNEKEFLFMPTISIDHKNTKNIAATFGIDQVAYSADGGETWSESAIKSRFGVNGNQLITFDSKGDLYYFHESKPGEKIPGNEEGRVKIIGHKSGDHGKTFTDGQPLGILPGDQKFLGLAMHPKKGTLYATWTQFDQLGLKDANCHSNVFYNATSNVEKWGKPVQISQNPGECLGDKNSVHSSSFVIGLDNKMFMTWVNQGIIFMDRSYDGGQSWITNDMGIVKQPNGWLMNVPGVGSTTVMPILGVDQSMTRRQGALYMTFADQNSGEDDTDIWLVRSLDRGDHWTAPSRVNQDQPGKHQYMPWMALDHTSGGIFVVYFDRRDYPDEDLHTDVYLAYSFDGGSSFKETKISESSFLSEKNEGALKQYLYLTANDGLIAPVWIRMDEGRYSVWTSLIKADSLK